MCELKYKVVPLIPMSSQLQEKLVWTGNNVFLSSIVSELHNESFDPLESELANAYHVTSSLTAEYECMESAAASLTPTSTPSTVSTCPVSVFVPTLGKVNTSAAIDWLHENYEEQDGISLPRGALYRHYLDHCQLTSSDPMNQASLGKVIRSIFPDVKTRRLGTRGQSKYHYYGMGIRDSSPYKDVMQTIQRISGLCSGSSIGRNFGGSLLNSICHSQQLDSPPCDNWLVPGVSAGPSVDTCVDSCVDSCGDICLDTCSDIAGSGGDDGCAMSPLSSSIANFPTVSHIHVSSSCRQKIDEFLSVYRNHCQSIVDTVMSGDFSEVRELLLEFWTSTYAHVAAMLQQEQLIALVTLYDIHLYKTLANQLVPTILHPLSTSTQCQVRSFVAELLHWLDEALHSQPEALRSKKMLVARSFGQCVRRRIGLGNMASAARRLLQDSSVVSKLQQDWRQLELAAVASECCALADIDVEQHHGSILKYLHEFEKLLYENRDIELYMSWIRSLIHTCVFVVADEKKLPQHAVGRHFMLTWTFVLKVIMKDLTLLSSDMFGSYHLLGMMFTDYTMYLIEQNERTHMTEHLDSIVYSGLVGARDFASGEDTDSLIHPPVQRQRKTQRIVTGRRAARRSASEDSSTRTTSRPGVSPSLVSLIAMPDSERMTNRAGNRRGGPACHLPSAAQGSAKQTAERQKSQQRTDHHQQQQQQQQQTPIVHNRIEQQSANLQLCNWSDTQNDKLHVTPSNDIPMSFAPQRSDRPIVQTSQTEQDKVCVQRVLPQTHHIHISNQPSSKPINPQSTQPAMNCMHSASLKPIPLQRSTTYENVQQSAIFHPFSSTQGAKTFQPSTLKAITAQLSARHSTASQSTTQETVISTFANSRTTPLNLLPIQYKFPCSSGTNRQVVSEGTHDDVKSRAGGDQMEINNSSGTGN